MSTNTENPDNNTIINDLFASVSKVMDEEKEKDKYRPGTMELLSIFNRHYENSNSDILAFLLDPNEKHRHGVEYLKLFLEQINIEVEDKQLEGAKVTREHFTDEDRRIDILITLKDTVIVIESKINSGEQENQLDAYYKFVKKQYKNKNLYLIFLTKKPQDAYTLSEANKEELGDNFQNITWGDEILAWIKGLPRKEEEIILKSALLQYQTSLEILTNQTKEDKEMSEAITKIIEKELKDNPKYWDTLTQINEARNSILKNMQETLSKLYNNLKEEKNINPKHRVVILGNQVECDKKDLDKWIKKMDIEAAGVGIEIKKGKLTLGFEAIDADGSVYYFGLMSHGEQADSINAKLKKFNIKLNDDEDWWYSLEEVNIINKSPDDLLEMILERYKQIKDIEF